MVNNDIENKCVEYIRHSVKADILSISIIGSYTMNRTVRPGSDIDIVVIVEDIDAVSVSFDNIFYKSTVVEDASARRIELNTKLDGIVLDITLMAHFKEPSSPLSDWYENRLGWCASALCIFGTPFPKLFDLDKLVDDYSRIKEKRLSIIDEKIAMTKEKINGQGRQDLHIIYELQTYVFIREIIKSGTFNSLSIKRPEATIPGFMEKFRTELREDCKISLAIEAVT